MHNPITTDTLSNLGQNEIITDYTAVVKSHNIRRASNQKEFAIIDFYGDNCEFSAKMWNVTEGVKEILSRVSGNNIVVGIDLTRKDYNGKFTLEVVLKKILAELSHDNIYKLSRVLDVDKYSIDKYINMIVDDNIRKICDKLWKTYKDNLVNHPAGKRIHHAFPGGWVEHTVEVISTGLSMMCNEHSPYSKNYTSKQIDRFICMAMVHDLGKLWELRGDGTYSLAGKSMGHLYISSTAFSDVMKQLDIKLNDEDYTIIINGIISHHRLADWGAISAPISLESRILHIADMYSMHLSKFIGYALNPIDITAEGYIEDNMLREVYYIDEEMKKFVKGVKSN